MNIRIKANKESGQRLSARDLGLLGKFPVLPIIHHNSKCQVMWCWRAFTKAVSFIFFFPFGFSLEDTDYLTSLCPSFSNHSFVLQAFCFTEGRAQCGGGGRRSGYQLAVFYLHQVILIIDWSVFSFFGGGGGCCLGPRAVSWLFSPQLHTG